jgi:alkylation response protein AidB-like acyl-CoA dehydrogenase
MAPRDVWKACCEMGMLCPDVPEAYGGPGGDFALKAIVHEELTRGSAASPVGVPDRA